MGAIFGKISWETPRYNVLASGEDYEIREYGTNIVAEVSYDPAASKGGGFMVLADYIGVLGKPKNVKGEAGEKIAMTAPVLTEDKRGAESEKIAMTAPVLTTEETHSGPMVMQFVLPSKYKSLEDVPRPTDPRVHVKEMGVRKYGVLKFNGLADDKLVETKVTRLRQVLEAAGYKVIGGHILAQYNPPWTVHSLRTNEVMLPIE